MAVSWIGARGIPLARLARMAHSALSPREAQRARRRFSRRFIAVVLLVLALFPSTRARAEDAASSNETPHSSAPTPSRGRSMVPYAIAAIGVVAVATGLGLYGYAESQVPDGCSAKGCQLRFSNGDASDGSMGALGKPCARDQRQDGCPGSTYNMKRELDTGVSNTWQTAGMIVGASGAVVLVASLIWYVREKPASEPHKEPVVASATIVPMVTDKLAGAALTAHF
jgi:hypothetical protein